MGDLDQLQGVPVAGSFASRHIGPDGEEANKMVEGMGYDSLDRLIDDVVPASIRLGQSLELPDGLSESAALQRLEDIMGGNRVCRSLIGCGYSDCHTPAVIQRNILENPGWYTAYTPYQAEIAQGRMEALITFQTMVRDLTAMDVANASLLDEGTAAAEAMAMCAGARMKGERFLVSQNCHPQTIDVLRTRAEPLGIAIEVVDEKELNGLMGDEKDPTLLGMLLQYPATDGALNDYAALSGKIHAAGGLVVVATDLLALTLLKPPGEWGADIVLGNSQRFGVPLGFGGPHAAFMACSDALKRRLPGRLVGVSKDADGRPALRLALQTREQHIRREKATSNICTAQVLLAVLAAMYAVYHGPGGLRAIALGIHRRTAKLARVLSAAGFQIVHEHFFDTLKIVADPADKEGWLERAQNAGINLRDYEGDFVGLSLDETSDEQVCGLVLEVFGAGDGADGEDGEVADAIPAALCRESEYLGHSVFHLYHTETEMLRYLRRLEGKDLALNVSMIPLGSCTMKLNAAAEMMPLSWRSVNGLHPFAPADQTRGYVKMADELEAWLAEITGFAAVSLQPNAGSQGEFAGLLAIRRYLQDRGESERTVCLIPTSAHGTNPASAVMAGFKVVPVRCDEEGNIDVEDIKAKAAQHAAQLGALMITYPSTHGVFEESVKEICDCIHQHGGQVYLDGANMNAQVGLCRPGDIGGDVCHLNLHKTFSIPHGGGGPGVGPIGVAEHLLPYLPGHREWGDERGVVCSAPYGSASILTISWMYLAMMGREGLTQATKMAILNANYIAHRLQDYFPVLYRGRNGLVAHECIVDLRPLKESSGIEVEDVAKRLMDYGYHAPTMSWPVPGTLMIEPTESESLVELDRFCEALISIHHEIEQVAKGEVDSANNVLKNAPHPAETLLADAWDRPYSRESAAYPTEWTRKSKFWPPVSRIDNVFGDRNLVCSCEGMEAYGEEG
jgi:glycine dehydrogenase